MPSSDIWKHFTKSGSGIACNYCPKKYGPRTSTSNMHDHISKKHPTQGAGGSRQTRIRQYARGPLSNAEEAHIHQLVARFICYNARPFIVVEGSGFKEMIHGLNPQYDLKSANFYHDLVKEEFDQLLSVVRNAVESAKFVSLTTDFWTSIAKHDYLTVTVHVLINQHSTIYMWLLKD